MVLLSQIRDSEATISSDELIVVSGSSSKLEVVSTDVPLIGSKEIPVLLERVEFVIAVTVELSDSKIVELEVVSTDVPLIGSKEIPVLLERVESAKERGAKLDDIPVNMELSNRKQSAVEIIFLVLWIG